ncbi:MAG: hypothetical protein DRP57_05045 [Spirochaetes bacterium]|nr:MAG: hypothetical protein DRP57_05045 [Spirochaetota bacterium]
MFYQYIPQVKNDPLVKACSLASVCGGGCRAGNSSMFRSYLKSDFRCFGPYKEPISKENVTELTPCFF